MQSYVGNHCRQIADCSVAVNTKASGETPIKSMVLERDLQSPNKNLFSIVNRLKCNETDFCHTLNIYLDNGKETEEVQR